MEQIVNCFILFVILVVAVILWEIIKDFFHNLFGDTIEKKITNGGMKICPHYDNVVTPRGSTCPVCQKKIG